MTSEEGFLAAFAIKSSLIVAACLLALALMRRASASSRHACLLAGTLALLAMPALQYVLPSWQVPVLWTHRLAAPQPAATAPDPVIESLHPATQASIPASIPAWALIWAVGAALVAIPLFLGLRRASQARRTSLTPSEDFRARIEALIGSGRAELLLGAAGRPPMTWGFGRPVLMLPTEAQNWPEDRLRSVLLHEAAHIERGDWLTQTIARLACALYWFHPGVWVIARFMESESEHAADDRVISQGCQPEDYAEHLIDVARSVRSGRHGLAVAMARRSPIRERLDAVLAVGRNRRPLTPWAKAAILLSSIALVTIVAAAGPRVIRHADPVTESAAEGPTVSISARRLSTSAASLPMRTTPESTAESPGPQTGPQGIDPDSDTGSNQADVGDDSSPGDPGDRAESADEAEGDTANARPHVATAHQGKDASREVNKAMGEAASEIQRAQAEVIEAEKQAGEEVAKSVGKIMATIPSIDTAIPEMKFELPEIKVDAANVKVRVPAIHVKVPGVHVHIPKVELKVPADPDN